MRSKSGLYLRIEHASLGLVAYLALVPSSPSSQPLPHIGMFVSSSSQAWLCNGWFLIIRCLFHLFLVPRGEFKPVVDCSAFSRRFSVCSFFDWISSRSFACSFASPAYSPSSPAYQATSPAYSVSFWLIPGASPQHWEMWLDSHRPLLSHSTAHIPSVLTDIPPVQVRNCPVYIPGLQSREIGFLVSCVWLLLISCSPPPAPPRLRIVPRAEDIVHRVLVRFCSRQSC